MKKLLLALLALSPVAAFAQTEAVVANTNGALVAPTNFFLANSNAIAAVAGGGGTSDFNSLSNVPTWISSNAATTRTNLSLGETNTPTFAGLILSTLTNANVRVATIGTNGAVGASSGVPSGAAASNSILAADGAGSSAFVASRTDARIVLTNVAKANWTNITSPTFNKEAQLGDWSLDANSVYKVEWAVGYQYFTNTAGLSHGFTFSGNVYAQTNSALGAANNPAGGGVTVVSPTSLTSFDLPNTTNATGTRFITGYVVVPTGTNAITMYYRWGPNTTNNTNALTLLQGTTISVTKLAP